MTEKEYKEHLCSVIHGVLRAEGAIHDEWRPLLEQAKNEKWGEDGRKDLYEAYLKAIADEMIRSYIAQGYTLEEQIKGVQ